MAKLDGQGRGTVADLTRRVKQMLADEKAEKPRPPSEPPVPYAATKHLKTLGTLTIQASSGVCSRSARQARGRCGRWLLLQAGKAAAAEATEVARHGACALSQPDEPPAVKVGSHLEVLVLIEKPEDDGSTSKAVASADAATAAVAVTAMNPRTRAARRRAAMNPRAAIAATRTRTRSATVVATMGSTSEVL